MGPPKQRALLALLLARAGQPVSLSEIVDVLWGQDPPSSAANVVHRYVGALRRSLEPGLPARSVGRWLTRRSGGYRLDVDAGTLDLLRFRSLIDRAQQAAGTGAPNEAVRLLTEALDLWQGPVAAGIPAEVRAHPVFTAVEREHLTTVKRAAETALDSGVPGQILAALQQAAARHPLDEALQAKLILVLAATGRQAEALDVHQAVRSRLADELGIDPGPELRAAQRQVLQQQTDRTGTTGAPGAGPAPRSAEDVPARQVPAPAPSTADELPPRAHQPHAPPELTVRPAQLPADLPSFSGRRAELARIRSLLPDDGRIPSTVVISAIGGMAGIGKTTFAVHWAHRIAHRFPDGQLYVNLRGFDPTGSVMRPAEAVRHFLDALGVPPQRTPVGLDSQTALYRSLLVGRRVLVLLDNARDTEHVRPLLPGSPGCLAIVTSRSQLHGLIAGDGAHPLHLDLLTMAEAREALVRRLGADRVAAEPQAVEEIVERCARLPLALAIVAARAATHPGFPLAAIAGELRDGHGSLDAFEGTDPAADARAVFSWSYRTLTPEAARLFRLLALHPGPDISPAAAASLMGLPVRRTRTPLAELTRAHLLSEQVPGRYVSHDLLRAYAAELTHELDSDNDRYAAQQRMFEHYLHTAHNASARLFPYPDRIPLAPPRAGAVREDLRDGRRAAAWLGTERSVLLAVVEEAAGAGPGFRIWQLTWALEIFMDRRGHWHDQAGLQHTALVAAQRSADLAGQANAHRALGFAHHRLARHDDARTHLLRALELFAELDDPVGESRTHRNLAFQANAHGDHDRALEHYEKALALYRSIGHRIGQAFVFNEVGWTYILLGEYVKALDHCGRAVELHRETGNPNGEAGAADSLGYAHHHLGQYDLAIARYQDALGLYQEIGDRYLEADVLNHIGDTHRAAGDPDAARTAWERSLVILEEFDHPDAVEVRDKLGAPVPPPAPALRESGGGSPR